MKIDQMSCAADHKSSIIKTDENMNEIANIYANLTKK